MENFCFHSKLVGHFLNWIHNRLLTSAKFDITILKNHKNYEKCVNESINAHKKRNDEDEINENDNEMKDNTQGGWKANACSDIRFTEANTHVSCSLCTEQVMFCSGGSARGRRFVSFRAITRRDVRLICVCIHLTAVITILPTRLWKLTNAVDTSRWKNQLFTASFPNNGEMKIDFLKWKLTH